jgi:hypothetical protein
LPLLKNIGSSTRIWKKGALSQQPRGMVNTSDNPLAPPSYAWGPEGVGRREGWHKKFGGTEDEGWRKSSERRKTFQYKK